VSGRGPAARRSRASRRDRRRRRVADRRAVLRHPRRGPGRQRHPAGRRRRLCHRPEDGTGRRPRRPARGARSGQPGDGAGAGGGAVVGSSPTRTAAYRERTTPTRAPALPPLAGQETAMTLLRTQLGNTLRGHRLRQRRTLRDVSGAARVSLGYLSEVERGQKEASSELLASICDALDVELADLLAEVSLEMRLAEPARRPVRPVAL